MKIFRIMTLITVLTVSATANVFAKPLKVYIMTGQSNMQGKARLSTMPAMAADPETKALHDKIVDADGKPRVYKNVHVAALSSRRGKEQTRNGPLTIGFGGSAGEGETAFGTEFAFGATLYEHLKEPILIIKVSWGGKSLCVDFRPPSADPYQVQPHVVKYMKSHNVYEKLEKSLADKRKKSGVYYDKMMKFVKTVLADPGKYCSAYDPKEGCELAGLVWFQGYNDAIDGHTYETKGPDAYKKYSRLLAHFIRDVRNDLKTPNMSFVIGVMGLGGNTDGPFQKAQAAPAAMPEFKDNVVAVLTGTYWDHKLGELDKRMLDTVTKPFGRQKKGLSKEKAKELKEKLIKEHFTDDELKYLEVGRSNAGFHYLGSAKIYSRIGEAFAGALLELKKE